MTPLRAKEPEVTGLSEVREKLEEARHLIQSGGIGEKAMLAMRHGAIAKITEALALMESEQGELAERIAMELFSAYVGGLTNGGGTIPEHDWSQLGDHQTGWLDTARATLGTESENNPNDSQPVVQVSKGPVKLVDLPRKPPRVALSDFPEESESP